MSRVAALIRVDSWADEVVEAFDDADIESVYLKGRSFAIWLYPGHENDRVYTDVDLLVRHDEYERAAAELRRHDFSSHDTLETRLGIPAHACTFIRRDGAVVDLHIALHGMELVSRDAAWRELSANTPTMPIGRRTVRILSEPNRVLHAVLHLRPNEDPTDHAIDDLTRAMAVAGLSAWTEAVATARRLEIEGEMNARLRQVPGGDALADALGLAGEPSLSYLLFRAEAFGGEQVLFYLRQRRGLAKLRYAVRFVIPPRRLMGLDSASSPADVATAYGRRLLHLVRGVPNAVRGYVRLRGRARVDL